MDLFNNLSETEKKQAKAQGMISAMLVNYRLREHMSLDDVAGKLGISAQRLQRLEETGEPLFLDEAIAWFDKLGISYNICIGGKRVATN